MLLVVQVILYYFLYKIVLFFFNFVRGLISLNYLGDSQSVSGIVSIGTEELELRRLELDFAWNEHQSSGYDIWGGLKHWRSHVKDYTDEYQVRRTAREGRTEWEQCRDENCLSVIAYYNSKVEETRSRLRKNTYRLRVLYC